MSETLVARTQKAAQPQSEVKGATFPKHTLKEALRVAEAIWNDNQGQPYDTIDLAKSLDTTPKSSVFAILLSSSYKYGLTEGSYKSTKIALTTLGSSLVAPTEGTDVKSYLRKALLTPDLFENIFNRLDRKPIPREEVFKNTLVKELAVGREDADSCYKIIQQNITDFGLSQDLKGSLYLQLDRLSAPTHTSTIEDFDQEEHEKPEEEISVEETSAPSPVTSLASIPKQVFVAHGKNKAPLEQLKNILTQFKVPFQVAIDEPHKGRAISEKVTDLMQNCTSGIFIFTADEEATDSQGNKILRPSDNVVFELGAGTVLYGKKIVIFREEDVSFGSDFTEYGRINFEKDRLDAKAFELMKELIGLGFLQVTPT